MKKPPLILTFFILVVFAHAQTIHIVDNRPSAPTGPHIFTTATDAIAASSPGDVIHMIPSSVDHSSFTISIDSLTIYGIGFNPNKEQPNTSSVPIITIATGTVGTRISGMSATDIFIGDGDGSISNIFIENCLVDRISVTSNGFTGGKIVSNVVIRNCVLGLSESSANGAIDLLVDETSPNSVLISNNIIMGSSTNTSGGYGSVNTYNAIIKNNLFLGNDASDFAFGTIQTSTISNNIFYGRAPITDALTGEITSSTFNNNLTFGVSTNTLISDQIGFNGVTGTGNIELPTTDPHPNVTLQDDWDFAFDPTLDGASAAVGGGDDATDIGITGSTLPFSTTGTPLPIITVLRFPEVITEGTNLDATIEAEGN